MPTSTTVSAIGRLRRFQRRRDRVDQGRQRRRKCRRSDVLGRRPSLREEGRQVREDPLGLADRRRHDDEREPDDRHEEREVDDEDRAGTAHDRQPLPEPAEYGFERRGEQDGDEDEQEDAGGRNADQEQRVDEDDAQGKADPPSHPERDLGPHVTGASWRVR